jgi:hypothetical protein
MDPRSNSEEPHLTFFHLEEISAIVVGITISLLVRHVVAFICTTRFDIPKFYVLPTQCIYVFCVDLRTNSDYFPIQH